MDLQNEKPILRAVSPDLPLLAARAAVQIDNIRAGKLLDTDAIEELRSLFKNSFEEIAVTGNHVSNGADGSTLIIVGDALEKVNAKSEFKTLDEIVNEARSMVVKLDQYPNSDLSLIRDFCVALSEAAASHSEDIYDIGDEQFRPADPL